MELRTIKAATPFETIISFVHSSLTYVEIIDHADPRKKARRSFRPSKKLIGLHNLKRGYLIRAENDRKFEFSVKVIGGPLRVSVYEYLCPCKKSDGASPRYVDTSKSSLSGVSLTTSVGVPPAGMDRER